MSISSKIALLKEMIMNAETNIKSAKQLLNELTTDESAQNEIEKYAKDLKKDLSGDEKIVEGIFDGQHMIGPDKKIYPVPANYASKSKLVEGDLLKLTIQPNGTFLYKQIGPVERTRLVATLSNENGQYKAITEDKEFSVLLASVTYFKGEIGDQMTIIVPTNKTSNWAAIDNVLPKGYDASEPPDSEENTF